MTGSFLDIFRGRRVLVTGHTGFKGAWLAFWLKRLGAKVVGYSLEPPTDPSLFDLIGLAGEIDHIIGDVRNEGMLREVFQVYQPEIVFHLAAQSLVRLSYKEPKLTYETNIIGTVNLFEAIRRTPSVRAVVNVTSDKCYENKEVMTGYRESDPMGGYDPYSSSKGGSELITSAYKRSYFNPEMYGSVHNVALASARAGNVIGGGDWATDRLLPDCIKSILSGEEIIIRYPDAIRPWQHVLEPLSGYLILARKLYEDGAKYSGAWNFGPENLDEKPVEWVVKRICERCGQGASYRVEEGDHLHEAKYLKLDCSKARERLGWRPRWNLEKALDATIDWVKVYRENGNLKNICSEQIDEYSKKPPFMSL